MCQRTQSFFWLSFIFLLFNSCEDGGMTENVSDPHSYARLGEARIEHMDLTCVVDFEEEKISGTATFQIKREKDTREIYLDAKNLIIEKVFVSPDGTDETETTHELGPEDPILGQFLKIDLKENSSFIHIIYETKPGSEALQFLPATLTTDKKRPFLLTQSQAINARTWIPIQDSPAIRFTYRATVKVPEDLLAVMSAKNPQVKSEYGVYEFEMNQKIPAYLLALAVGDFSYKEIGDRCGVYAEPSVLDDAATEFAELPEMIRIAESMYGSYEWERYDVIVLPSSFPFGGMENPRMTFVTPTVIAGDSSLVSLLAHELAHSWSGNLVTNATWNDFWLNEGFTVYFENRIMEKLKGEGYAEMLAQLSYQELGDEVERMKDNKADTRLALELEGRNPDDGMTSIAYDKGFYFLKLIEKSVGRASFDSFLRKYFSDFAFKSMDTKQFLELLETRLFVNYPDIQEVVRTEDWVYGEGIPGNIPFKASDKFVKVEEHVNSWIAGISLDESETDAWSTHEWLHFIRSLPASISPEQMEKLDKDFSFSKSKNSEIQALWYRKAIVADYEKAYPAMRKFLTSVGRRKFLVPLYRSMIEEDRETELAHDIYKQARSTYHPISVTSLDELLSWEE